MKSYTTIEQSKILAKILPLESADMFLAMNGTIPVMSKYIDDGLVTADNTAIPCWSLASLLNYLKNKNKFPEIKELSDGRFKLTTYIWDDKDCIQVSIGDSIVDACYEMILKLNKMNLL